MSITRLDVEAVTKPASAWSLLSKSHIHMRNRVLLCTKQSLSLINTNSPSHWTGPSQEVLAERA